MLNGLVASVHGGNDNSEAGGLLGVEPAFFSANGGAGFITAYHLALLYFLLNSLVKG